MTILLQKTPRVPLVANVILIWLSAIGCGRGNVTSPAEGPPAAEARAIDVIRVVEQPLDVTLSIPAELVAYQNVVIYSRVTGFVQTIPVDRGSRVRTGDLLAVLEAPELVAQAAEAQSKVQSAQAQLLAVRSKADASAATHERLRAAAATPGVIAGNDLLVSEKAAEADRSQLAAAQQNVEAATQVLTSLRQMEQYLRITAPFDGVIAERAVHPGALVGPATGASGPMFRLVQDRRLRLVVPVSEAYVAGVKPGNVVMFGVGTYPAERFAGTVARIAGVVDVQTRTMPVELDVMNSDGRLAPGTFCQVQWPVRRTAPSLLVPAASIASTTDRTFVVRIRDGRTEWIDVRPGLASGSLVEVFSDLRPGDQVAARGSDELRAGTEVRVNEITAKPEGPG
jgi:RND family efflux transporter MFP subunit